MATFEPTSLTGRSVPQTWACQIFQTVLGAAPSEAALPTRCRRHAIPSVNVNGRDGLDRPCGPLSRRSGLQNAVALHFRRCLKSIFHGRQMVAKSHNVPPLFTAELTLGMPNFVFFASANGTASSLSPPLPPRLDEPRERGAAPGFGEKSANSWPASSMPLMEGSGPARTRGGPGATTGPWVGVGEERGDVSSKVCTHSYAEAPLSGL